MEADKMVEDILTDYLKIIKNKAQHQLGYCYNFKYDFSEVMPFLQYTINNLGDPYVNSLYQVDSRQFEQEVIQYFAQLFNLKDSWGYVTAGGTEGNLYAMALARETFPDAKLYASSATHYSIAKATHLFKMNLVTVKVQSNDEMDYPDFYNKLDPQYPAIINCNIGTTFTGAIDNLDLILEVLNNKKITNFYIHCDGALSGMYVPYVKKDLFDFDKPIHSLSISGHKFIGSPFPSGVVITQKKLSENLKREVEYIGSKDTTILGSRNGHAALFLWYAIKKYASTFAHSVNQNIINAQYLVKQLNSAQVDCLLNPCSSIVVFPKPNSAICDKWQLSLQGNLAHIAIMQQHDKSIIDVFLEEYLADGKIIAQA